MILSAAATLSGTVIIWGAALQRQGSATFPRGEAGLAMIGRQYEFLLAGRRTVVILNGHVDRFLSAKAITRLFSPARMGFLSPDGACSLSLTKNVPHPPDRTCFLSSDRTRLLWQEGPCLPDRTGPMCPCLVPGLPTGRVLYLVLRQDGSLVP